MTHKVDTAFDRTFSEPPKVAVSAERTHCEACKEPLAPDVIHKCHGNKHYEPRAVSHTHVTEKCPECDTGEGTLITARVVQGQAFTVVCKACRTYLWPLVIDKGEAIASWNTAAATHKKGCWPRWLAGLPGDEQVKQEPQSVATSAPDLTNYKGVCPTCNGTKGKLIDAETGAIDPCTHCDGKGVIE